MQPIKAIEYKVWKNTKTNRTVSTGGACPWWSDAGKADWILEPRGWTILFDNGTTGFGRPPFATKEEAEQCIRDWNK